MFRPALRAAFTGTTLLLGLLAVATRLIPVREGLNGDYYANGDWASPAAVSSLDTEPSTQRLLETWHGAPPEIFSASWAGSFLVWRDGLYTFSTISDDGSWVYVDGRLVVDNGGRHGPSAARGSTALTRGVHAILIRYVQEGGDLHLDVLWGRNGETLAAVPGWALTPRKIALWRFVGSAALRLALAAVEWLWVAVALALVVVSFAGTWATRARAWFEREQVWPALAWIVAGSLVLNIAGIWWGLPGGSRVPDELTPGTVMGAAATHFSHGWFDRYPPFHYYVLTAAYSPLFLLQWWGRIDLSSEPAYTVLALLGRLVSVAGGVGTLIAVYACGVRVFGRRAGLCAAAMLALVAPFVYYAKTANLDVPYVFWFSVSLLFYLRVLDGLKLLDLVGFAACATLSVVTKDQAYGLYLLTPVVIIERMWRVNRDAGVPHPLVRAVFDRRLAAAAVVATTLFVCSHNLIFNWSGFVEHVHLITGGGSESFRVFDRTVAGRVALLLLTVDLVREAWGWPLFLVSVAGIGVAILRPRWRLAALWLAIPVVSYYAGFINVVLYNYDRFVLPICVVLSLFGGLALDRWLAASARARTWRIAAVAALGAYALLYAATVDVAMLRDSRYRVEEWLAAHVRQGELVGFMFPLQYYPRLEGLDIAEISSIEKLQAAKPSYYVLNADYGRSARPGSPIDLVISGLQGGKLGYELAFRFREPSPWRWLPGGHRDLVGPRAETVVTSSLRHINPTFEVFKRQR